MGRRSRLSCAPPHYQSVHVPAALLRPLRAVPVSVICALPRVPVVALQGHVVVFYCLGELKDGGRCRMGGDRLIKAMRVAYVRA